MRTCPHPNPYDQPDSLLQKRIYLRILTPDCRNNPRILNWNNVSANIRHLFYMAALSAIRCEPSSQACYQRLTANGKPHKVALVAVMRRLVGLLDTLLRQDRLWRAQPPARPLEAAT